MKQRVDDALWALFKQTWLGVLHKEGAIRGEGQNKMRTYRIFKRNLETEQYIQIPMPVKHRKALAKFHCGVAPIRIATGRYGANKTTVQERTCSVL